MTKHFYAVDHAEEYTSVSAFKSKSARDGFVENGNRRFSKTRVEADELCKKFFDCNAVEAVARGLI